MQSLLHSGRKSKIARVNRVRFQCNFTSIFHRNKLQFGCNSEKHSSFEQQFLYSAGTNAVFSKQQLKATLFFMLTHVLFRFLWFWKSMNIEEDIGVAPACLCITNSVIIARRRR